MTDYSELVKALRIHASVDIECYECAYYDDCCINGNGHTKMMSDAAAAIEALQAELIRIYKQLPKRGEWVLQASGQDCKCSVCESYWIPFGDEYDYKFCPNCGAQMNDSNVLNALDNAQDGPIITPCRGCSDYDGYGGCKSKGGCAMAKMEAQDGQ